MSLLNRSPASRRGRSRKRAISVESTMTTELTLPGLTTPEVVPALDPNHWIERTPQKRLTLFAGPSNMDLAQQIAERVGVEVGAVERQTVANREPYRRYGEAVGRPER